MWLPSFWKDLTKSSGRCKTTPLEQCDRQLVSLASTKIHTKTCLKSLRTWRKLKKDKTLTTGIPYQWIIKHPLKCELLEDRDYFGSFFYFVFFISPALPHMVGVPLKDWMCVSNRTFYFLFIKQNKHFFFFFFWKTFWIIFVQGKRRARNLPLFLHKQVSHSRLRATEMLTLRNTFKSRPFVLSPKIYQCHMCEEILSRNFKRETK